MRSYFTPRTKDKILKFFQKNKLSAYSCNAARELTGVDYYSVKLVVEQALKDKILLREGNKFRWREN
jgi:hypothetical protein